VPKGEGEEAKALPAPAGDQAAAADPQKEAVKQVQKAMQVGSGG
jgi:hypothetical protein